MGMKVAGSRLCLKGGLLNRNVYIMARSAEDTEFPIGTGAYARILRNLASWTRAATGRATNTAAANFPTPTAVLGDPTFVGLASAANGGNVLWTGAVTGDPSPPGIGASFGFDAGALGLSIALGAITARGSVLAFEEGIVSGSRWMTLHSNDPGTTGSNQQGAAVSVAEGLWDELPTDGSKVRNNAVINFGVQTSDLPDLMWAALRDAASGGNVLWRDAFDNNPDDPAAGDTISFPINDVVIGVNADA